MMKRLMPLWILLGIAVFAGVALWLVITFVAPEETRGEEKANSIQLIDTDLSAADYVDIRNQADAYKLVRDQDGDYYIEGKKGYAIDSYNLSTLLTNLGDLQATAKVVDSPSEEQLEGYGLKNPAAVVTVRDGMESYTLRVGTTTATGTGSYYLQLNESDTVYLVSATLPEMVRESRYQFYTGALAEYSEDTTAMQTLKWFKINGTKTVADFEIRMNELGEDEVGSSYILTSPIRHSLSIVMQEYIYALLPELNTAAIINDDVSKATLKKYGLDRPAYTFSFVQNGNVQTVHFGDVNEATGMQYCYAEGGKFIHQLGVSTTSFMGNPMKDFCEDMIYTRAADTLSAIKVTGKGKTYQINIGEKDEVGNFNVSINNRHVDSELFSDFYSHILMIGITDMGDRGNAKEPLVTVQFTLKDKTVETMKFYTVSELKCYCELNGKGNFLVTMMNVEKILENAQKLYNGETINTEW